MNVIEPVVLVGHVMERLRELPDESVHEVLCSPPYFGLRSYGTNPQIWGGDPFCEHEWATEVRTIPTAGYSEKSTLAGFTNPDTKGRQMDRADWTAENAFCVRCSAWRGELGSEPTPELFISHLVEVFHEVKRVLRKDGTLFVNIGDSYAGSNKGVMGDGSLVGGPKQKTNKGTQIGSITKTGTPGDCKPKDLIGVPWMLAFALRADGWVLRQEIIWEKPNAMPESVTDRCTKSHESIFTFARAKWTGPEPRRFSNISDDDARWLALFLDTEGNICARRSKVKGGNDHFSTQICFASSNRPLLLVTQKIIGAGTVLKRKGKNAPMYYLQMSCNQAADLLHRIYPFLIVKARQARLAIHLQDVIAKSGRERRTKEGQLRGRTRSDDYTAELVDIWAMMKSLNHFGDPDMSWVPEPETGRWSGCERYFYDQNAIREPVLSPDRTREKGNGESAVDTKMRGFGSHCGTYENGRNKRSVWSINTQPYSEAHFATWPEELAETIIKAGTSEKGCCPQCGAPWKRVIAKTGHVNEREPAHVPGNCPTKTDSTGWAPTTVATTDWEPTCRCGIPETIPCTVLDPFGGSGTTGLVATRLGRKSILIELNPEYAAMAKRRTAQLGFAF